MPIHQDIEAIQQRIHTESAFVSRLLDEVGKVIVGQHYMIERLLIGMLADGHVLMEGVPKGIDAQEVGDTLVRIDGGLAIHDMHIWSLSSSNYALAAHVDIDLLARWPGILPQIQQLLRERFGITHSTLQPEDRVLGARCELSAECGTRYS